MGFKRLNRSRLYNTERKGLDVMATIGVAIGMREAVVSATQHRLGYQVITDIVLDLGTSKATILTGGTTADNPIGESGLLATICTMDADVFGMVTNVETLCLEELSTNGTAYANNLNIALAAAANCVQGASTGSPAAISDLSGIAASLGTHKIDPYDDDSLKGTKSLCLVAPAAAGTKVLATANLTGLNDHANIATGDKLTLYKADGTKVELLFDKALAHGTAQALKIGLNGLAGGATGITQAEASAKVAIEAVGFTTNAADDDGTLTISQVAGTGADGNSEAIGSDNSVVKAAGSLAVTNFTGGTTQGNTTANATAAFTGGKFLIRITGFLTPADK